MIFAPAVAKICETSHECKILAISRIASGNIQQLADENFERLKKNPRHPSLHFKKVGRFWSARIGIHYRAAAVEDGNDVIWFWIGHHSEYDRIISAR
jgi:hypothetical protein